MKKVRTIGEVSLSAIEDQWQRDATAAAIAGARGVIHMGGPIPPGTPIGRLSDIEWGWIVAAILSVALVAGGAAWWWRGRRGGPPPAQPQPPSA